MNVHASDWTAYEKSRPRCNEYQPSHQGATLLAAELGPTDAPNKGADYPDQNAHPERIIMMLNEVVAEVDRDVDIESGNPQSDQEGSGKRYQSPPSRCRDFRTHSTIVQKLALIAVFPENGGVRKLRPNLPKMTLQALRGLRPS